MTENKRVLVADDDVELRNLLKFYLSKRGYEVTTVENGLEAVDAAGKQAFDLIMLDVMMPELDGYHAAQTISDRLGDNCPKILIMTSRDTEKEQGVAIMSGAHSTLQKPFKLAELKTVLAGLFAGA